MRYRAAESLENDQSYGCSRSYSDRFDLSGVVCRNGSFPNAVIRRKKQGKAFHSDVQSELFVGTRQPMVDRSIDLVVSDL